MPFDLRQGSIVRPYLAFIRRLEMEGAMSKAIHPGRAGLVLGTLIGGWHLLWALLVALGWAQPLIDFIFWLHFIKPVYVVGKFDAGIAALLVGLTAVIGFVSGGAFGVLWNRFHGT
jgi:hypothetical protein